MVCLGLSRVEHPNGRYQRESVQRAIDWVLSMQCKNGGWASFDKDNDRMVFQYVPLPITTPCLIRRPSTSRADSGVSRELRVQPGPSGGETGAAVYSQRAGAGRKLVWTLGRELHLRHNAGVARTGGNGRGSKRSDGAAGGGVDALGAECRWRLGRDGGVV